tara:strand:- start:142 stop:516 length:375 start_codon:yes stop_codon:yes gene_type:complete
MAWASAGIKLLGGGFPGRRPGGKPVRKPRKLTTSEAAIRRAEARKRRKHASNSSRPRTRKPWGPQGGPRADARPTGGGRRTSRTSQTAINRSKNRLGPTPSKGRRRTTSQAAISRYKAMRGRRR